MTQSDGRSQLEAQTLPDEATPGAARPAKRRPPAAFAWGLAAGVLSAVTILAIAAVAYIYVMTRAFDSAGRGGPQQAVVVQAAKAGAEDWVKVSKDGTGSLQAWSYGSSGTGGEEEPAGSVAFFEVGALDSIDGVKIMHVAVVYLTRDTEVVVGGKRYGSGKASSAAEAIFGEDAGPADVLDQRLLTITFHLDGDRIVADTISAPLESEENPLQGR